MVLRLPRRGARSKVGESGDLTALVQRALVVLEKLAAEKGLRTPKLYAVIFFRSESELRREELQKLSDDVFVGSGVIAVKLTDIAPLLVERIAVGYYTLCYLESKGVLDFERAWRMAREELLSVLAQLGG